MILLDAEGLTLARPGRTLFADLACTIRSGDRLGVVGLNGCGKSTLLSVLAGETRPDAGVVRRGRGVRISVLPQDPQLPPGPVRDAVGEGWEGEAVLDRLGMGDLGGHDTTTLSGGQAKRVALARTLVRPHDLLVLDEPTNHLDIDGIAWLETHLAASSTGLLLVTHDRHLLDAVTTRVLELEWSRAHLHDGGYESWLAARAERVEREAREDSVRRNLARAELAWLRRGAPARTRKPRARVEAARELLGERALAPERSGTLPLHHGTPRLGSKVIELDDVAVGHTVGHPLIEHLDLLLDNRERLGVVGPNGAGKTTLLDVLAGRLEPLAGRIEWGPTVQVGYHDQAGRTLDPAVTVRSIFAGDAAEPDGRDLALLERFWFAADVLHSPVGLLSGGERRRLQLVAVLAERPNVLLLDEPTNDLDLDTLRALEDFLEEWPGALVAVSHDRAFLERTVTDVIVVEGDGRAGRWPGGYGAWEEQRQLRRGAATRRGRSDPRRPPAASGADEPGRVRTRTPSTLRHLLREVERRMARIERRRDELAGALAEAGGDHEALAAIGGELAGVSGELAAAEDEWLRLSEEAEAARGGG